MLGLYFFPLEEISTHLQTFSRIQKRHLQRHRCYYCLWNVKVSCEALQHFSNIFFKLSARNTAELLVLLSQIQLSDSMENGSIRNKCFGYTGDTKDQVVNNVCISPKGFFSSFGNQTLIHMKISARLHMALSKWEQALIPWTEGQHKAARLFCISGGGEHVQKPQPGLGLCDPWPVTKDKSSFTEVRAFMSAFREAFIPGDTATQVTVQVPPNPCYWVSKSWAGLAHTLLQINKCGKQWKETRGRQSDSATHAGY